MFVPVIGDGATGAALLRQPVDGVFFTGSYATGKKIAAAAGRRMIKVQLELGGKDPIYVCEDVDVKAAATALADGAFYNNGQSCCAVERIYVADAIHDAFVDAFVAEVRGFRVGDPMNEATYLGAVTRRAQLDVLKRQVADATQARRQGADRRQADSRSRQLVRAHRRRQRRSPHEADARRELRTGDRDQRVRDDDEAVALMNDNAYGLTAGVYSASESARRRSSIASRPAASTGTAATASVRGCRGRA